MVVVSFKKIPNGMTIDLVYFCVFWLNATLVKSGISSIYSPRELIYHQKMVAQKWCKLMLCDCVEVHKGNIITDSTKPRTRSAIYMGP